MARRILLLARALLAARLSQGEWPVAPLVAQGSFAALLAWLARDGMGAWPWAACALSLSLALVALPLLGEFAPVVADDPAREWLEAQPARPIEVRVARALAVATLVWIVAAAALLPLALLAPPSMDVLDRCALFGAGLAQATFLAASLLAVHAWLGARAHGALVALQTALMALVVVGGLVGVRHLGALRELDGPSGWLHLSPSAWFAHGWAADGSAWPALAASAAAGLLLAFGPPGKQAHGGGGGLRDALLAPLRRLALSTWVRRDERAGFAFTWEALPKERDFVLRTYPLLGIPLAFLWVGLREGDEDLRGGTIALLLFAPAIYLPVLLSQVPGSRGHAARWILDGAPCDHAPIESGAHKALCLRVLLPLFALLVGVALAVGEGATAARLAPVAFLATCLLARALWGRCVAGLPLSVAPERVEAPLDMTGTMVALAFGATLLATASWALLSNWGAVAACAALLFALRARERRAPADPVKQI
ncbi:MAG: hypothetical protein ACK57N_01845 [Planctomycetia bacterium]